MFKKVFIYLIVSVLLAVNLYAAEPASLPKWDENDTNTLPITTEQQDDGFVLKSKPASGTFNAWMRNVYKWTEWFQEKFTDIDSDIAKLAPVDSIADLRAITYTPEDGQIVDVLGYSTPGDGGGNTFYWDATSTETDNSVTVFKVTAIATGRWETGRLNKITTTQAGCIDGADATSEFQNLITVIKTYAGEYPEILIDNANITISDTLTIDATGIIINGLGAWGSAITFTADSKPLFLVNGVEHVRFSNFIAISTATTASSAFKLTSAPNTSINNILTIDFHKAVETTNSWNLGLTDSKFFGCKTVGAEIGIAGNDTDFNNVIITCDNSPTSICVTLASAWAVSVNGGAYEDAGDVAFEVNGGSLSLNTYIESNGSMTRQTSTNSHVEIQTVYAFNNGTGSLISGSGGTITLNTLIDGSAIHAARIFALTGGCKAFYHNIQYSDSSVALGTCDPASGGKLTSLSGVAMETFVTEALDSSVTQKRYLFSAGRPWKIAGVKIIVLSGTPVGAVVEFGTLTDPDSLGSYTLTNVALQIPSLATDLIQTVIPYTDQTGEIFMTVTGGGAGSIQAAFSCYRQYQGASIGNTNDADALLLIYGDTGLIIDAKSML